MTALADSPAAHHDRSAYRGPGGAGAGRAAVSGPVVPADRSGAVRDRDRTASQADEDQVEHPKCHKPPILPALERLPRQYSQVSNRYPVLEPHRPSSSGTSLPNGT